MLPALSMSDPFSQIRTRPASSRRAALSAWSARRIISCASMASDPSVTASPAPNSRRRIPPWYRCSSRRRTRFSVTVRPTSRAVSNRMTANVAPPYRATWSRLRRLARSAVAISPRTRSPERRSRRSLTHPKLSGPRRISTACSFRSAASASAMSSSAWNSGLCGRPVTWSKRVRETVRACAAKAAASPRKFFHHRSSLRLSEEVGNCRRPSSRRAAVAGVEPQARPGRQLGAQATRPACGGPGRAPSSLESTQPRGMR